jgi:hypothetical protein
MAVTKYYTANGQICGESTNGVRTTYGTDALGSVTGTYDQDGNPQNSYLWAPYGTLVQKTGTATDPKFGWNGASGYRNTGRNYSAYYARAREFDLITAQWTTVDSLWPHERAWAYARSAPTYLIDPSGLGTGGGSGGIGSTGQQYPCCVVPSSVNLTFSGYSTYVDSNGTSYPGVYVGNVYVKISFFTLATSINLVSPLVYMENLTQTGDFLKSGEPNGVNNSPMLSSLTTSWQTSYPGTCKVGGGSSSWSYNGQAVDNPHFDTNKGQYQVKNGTACNCQMFGALDSCGITNFVRLQYGNIYIYATKMWYVNVSGGKVDQTMTSSCESQCNTWFEAVQN